jgi:transaldolase
MPLNTLEATKDHAEVRQTITGDATEARAFLEELEKASVDYDEVVEVLEQEGVKKFSDAFDELLQGIEEKASQLKSQPVS